MGTTAVEARRSGWLTFAAVLMFAVGFARVVSGLNYLNGGDQVSDLTNSLFGDQLWVWGIWDLGIAALALFAGLSLLAGGSFGKAVASIWAVVLLVQSMLLITAAPWYGAAAIALAVLVLYGLFHDATEEL